MQVTPALLRSSTDKVIAPLACRALFKQMATLPIVRVRKYPANRCVATVGLRSNSQSKIGVFEARGSFQTLGAARYIFTTPEFSDKRSD
jgi:hypothetical protein